MDFITPGFLQNRSTEDFLTKIKKILPKDLDVSQGSHEWNMVYPSALVAAEICEFILPEVIRLIIPEWSYGEFVDGHAKRCGLTRKAATAATGELTITGAANSIIPAGSLFSTAAINNAPSVDYSTLAEVSIPSSGSVTVEIKCTQTGIVGNTTPNTIVLVSSKLTGITAVTNAEAVAGGTEEEDDESLIARISEYEKSQGESFIGNLADYKRWAKEAGAGDAVPIPPTDDSGVITLIVTDGNGEPATEQLIEKVYNYIMRPDDRESRLAPCGALLSVVAPETIAIAIKAVIELDAGATIASVKADFAAKLASYLPAALEQGEVKYKDIAAVLASVTGAY
ncbi:MAG: baseplate J/gp47 family protein, partial [Lachnospiraceae bacterium]|nr:baseplate J/gp47 family protein [Lachnospiraceae bacterium]